MYIMKRKTIKMKNKKNKYYRIFDEYLGKEGESIKSDFKRRIS